MAEPLDIALVDGAVDSNQSESRCSICLDEMNEHGGCTTLECGHQFHVNCIVSWFRRGPSTCPMCRSVPPANEGGQQPDGYHDSNARFYINKRLGARRGAPRLLAEMVKKWKQYENQQKQRRREFSEWKRTVAGRLHAQLDSKYMQLRRRRWTGNQSMFNLQTRIANYPVVAVRLND